MRFSIITPSFNCGAFILENIESVRRQELGPEELEHWIIDGGSQDGTVELLKKQKNIKWISEPDRGLSDAVNKGIQRAAGDWIVWLNADDLLADGALQAFLKYAQANPTTRVFAGDQSYLAYDGSVEAISKGWDYNLKDLLGCRTAINQASTFVHREVFQKVGLLDLSDRYTMDYEWTVRAMHHYQCVAIPTVLTCYRRRKGSITDAHLVKQFERFLTIRRFYGQPRFSRAELRIRFFIYTNWLRKITWLRRGVRTVKSAFGKAPLHPMH